MEKSTFNISTLALITLLVSFGISGFAYASSMEAERHMARGAAAMEDAKSPVDYLDAVKEFSEVVEIESDWVDAWYNLGTAQESAEQYQAAIKSFQTYLEQSLNASDRDEVQTRIFKLEYKMEKAEKEKAAEVRRSTRETNRRIAIENTINEWKSCISVCNGKGSALNKIKCWSRCYDPACLVT